MIPNVFISSTISDLHHLRDSIRELIKELGYNPINSEYGDVGYSFKDSAEKSCYFAARDCQLAIVIIDKKYGKFAENNVSVTHNEFRALRDKSIPIIFLISEEVLLYKTIYDRNKANNKIKYPSMDKPEMTFSLIDEFREYPLNNGYVSFKDSQNAKENIKKHLAHNFYRLLKNENEPSQQPMIDILSEIKTLKQYLITDTNDTSKDLKTVKKFTHAIRFLLDKDNALLSDLITTYSGDIEIGVAETLQCKNLDEYLKMKKVKFHVTSTEEHMKLWAEKNYVKLNLMSFGSKSASIYDDLFDESDMPEDVKESFRLEYPAINYAYGKNALYLSLFGKYYLDSLFILLIDETQSVVKIRRGL